MHGSRADAAGAAAQRADRHPRFGSWWMDLPACGWYMDTRLWDLMARLEAVRPCDLNRARPFTPEVAAIVDETSMMYLSTRARLFEVRVGAARGVWTRRRLTDNTAFGCAGKAARRQAPDFQSAWYMTPERIAAINAQRAAKPDVTRVWCGRRVISRPAARRGRHRGAHRFQGQGARVHGWQRDSDRGGRRRGLPERLAAKDKHPFVDLFGVEATDAETWARFEDGTPAIAVRKNAFGGNEVFLGTPACPPELVRALADLRAFTVT